MHVAEAQADTDADVVVYVIAEVVKPEDSATIGALGARRPVLVVLNKADLTGFAGDGPIAAARARCAEFARLPGLVGTPVEPMIGLLAALDDLGPVLDPLRRLADAPVPAEDRLQLLNSLDLFGTALAVAAVRKGCSASQLRTLLRHVSGVDAVVAKIDAIGAQVRYGRVLDAVAALEALAVCAAGSGDRLGDRIGEFLAHDDTVVARMADAAGLASAAGLTGPESGAADGPAHLCRATWWQQYSADRQVSDVHRACAADIARGSLRLWSRAARLGVSR
jgi:hypothetical protein